MTKRLPQPRSELSPSVREHEATLLAVMLRTARLSWVFGEPGVDKSALLKSGVMPLLQRRSGDFGRAAAATPRPCPTPDRRRRLRDRPAQRRVEAAIYFDTWGPASLSQLKSRIGELLPAASAAGAISKMRLAETLRRLQELTGLQVIFLLDRFEDYLAMAPDAGDAAAFANELMEVISSKDPPASFLIALDEGARPRLERFRSRIPGFDHNSLRLTPVSELHDQAPLTWPAITSENPLPTDRTLPVAPGSAPPIAPPPARKRRGPPPRVPIKVEDIYEFVESTLTKTSAQGGRAPFEGPTGTAASMPGDPMAGSGQPPRRTGDDEPIP